MNEVNDKPECFNCDGAGEAFAVDGCPCCADEAIEQEPEDHDTYDAVTDSFRTVKV